MPQGFLGIVLQVYTGRVPGLYQAKGQWEMTIPGLPWRSSG